MRTKRLVAYTLHKNGMSDPDDVDDCMQSAYFKIWKDLQSAPDRFADKPLTYIIRCIFYATKVQRYSHMRNHNKNNYYVEPEHLVIRELSVDQVGTWIDIQSAVAQVVEDISDNPFALFALYTLLTQAKVGDVQKVLGCSHNLMTKYRNQVRKQLAEYLPNYRHTKIDSDLSQSLKFIPLSVARAIFENA
ncbi:MAG: hypothetical protein Phog2KO_47410 [Phototrophicaceae bacterium]